MMSMLTIIVLINIVVKNMGVEAMKLARMISLILLLVIVSCSSIHASEGFEGPLVPFMEIKTVNGNAYLARTSAGRLFISHFGELYYSLRSESGTHVRFKEVIEGLEPFLSPASESVTRIVFYYGDENYTKKQFDAYRSIRIGKIGTKIGVELALRGNNVEKLFIVEPGGDVDRIRIKTEGTNDLKLLSDGSLEIITKEGPIYFTKPVAYQVVNGRKNYVSVSYRVLDNGYGFSIGRYDRSRRLVIDPLLASTYFGVPDGVYVRDIAVNKQNGNVYIAGYVDSYDYGYDFPATIYLNPSIPVGMSWHGGFVAVFNNDLSQLISCAFIAANAMDVRAVDVAGDGSVFIAGTVSGVIPFSGNAYQKSCPSYYIDNYMFVMRLNANLTQLISSTGLCGYDDLSIEGVEDIAVSPDGYVYVTGETSSQTFPTTKGAYDRTYNDSDVFNKCDAFIVKFDFSLSELKASTFLGGDGLDRPGKIVLYNDKVFVGGYTESENFPVTDGVLQGQYRGVGDLFVSVLDKDLSYLISSTFFGGTNSECFEGMDISSTGELYVAGTTYSNDLSVVQGGYETTAGIGKGFIVNLSTSLKYEWFFTYFDSPLSAIAVSKGGDVYVAGTTYLPISTPVLAAVSYAGEEDIVVARFNRSLSSLLSFSYLGGSEDESDPHIALDADSNLFVTGITWSMDFPVKEGAYRKEYADLFVSKFDPEISVELAPFNPVPIGPVNPYSPFNPAPFNPVELNMVPKITSFTATPSSGDAPLEVRFKCEAYDSDGSITQYRWDFDGDGNVDRITAYNSVEYVYSKAGTYTAWVRVVDNMGAFVGDNTTVTVSEAQSGDNGTYGGNFTVDRSMLHVSVYSSPLISRDGDVYFGSSDKKLIGFKDALDSVSSSVTLDFQPVAVVEGFGDYLYITSLNAIYRVSLSRGVEWSYAADGVLLSYPAVAPDGSVFFADDKGNFYGVDASGNEIFRVKLKAAVTKSSVVMDRNTLYLGDVSGNLYRFDTEGNLLWSKKLPDSSGITASPAIDGDRVYVVSTGGRLYCFDKSGNIEWSYGFSPSVSASSPVVDLKGNVYIGASDGNLYAISDKGILKWSFKTGDKILSSPTVTGDGVILVGSDDGYLYAVTPDGSLKWKYKASAPVRSAPLVDDSGNVWFSTVDGYGYLLKGACAKPARGVWPRFHGGNHNRGNVAPFPDISDDSYAWAFDAIVSIYHASITDGYPDGTYRPYNGVSRAEMAAFLTRALGLSPAVCTTEPFPDVPKGAWYCPYVQALKEAGVAHGRPDGKYAPLDNVSRAQMAAFMARALNLSVVPCTTKPFPDVAKDAWYCPYVQAIKLAGITKGFPDGTYRPDDTVTRAQMAVYLFRAFGER